VTISLVQTPAYPTTRKPVAIKFSGATGNFVRVWVTDAPVGSKLRGELDKASASLIQVFEGDTTATWTFSPDVGGKYLLTAQEYTRGASSYGGGYAGDPAGYATETAVGAAVALSIVVGDRLTFKVGAGSDTATLVVWVWDDTIRATRFDLHGEVSPALTEASSARAATAANQAAVRTLVASFAGLTSGALVGDLSTLIPMIVDTVNAHMSDPAEHQNPDATNVLPYASRAPATKKGIVETVSLLLASLGKHLRSDGGYGTGSADGATVGAVTHPLPWHYKAGQVVADLVNGTAATGGQDVSDALNALGDIVRVYNAHDADTRIHGAAFGNQIGATSPLLSMIGAFFSALSNYRPPATSTENPGAVVLVHGAGMKKG
jgi:hypothetical protein